MDAERASFLAAASAGEPAASPAEAAVRPLLDEVLTRQVSEDAPPEVWQTVRRLLDAGIAPADVYRQLRLALGVQILGVVGEDAELDEESYVASLARLPLPSPERVEAALVEVVRERQPIDADEVDRLAAERLGLASEDPLAEMLLDQLHEGLLDDGPLALLASDEVVHVPTLVDGIVLSHRLTEAERSSGVLIATDLPALDRVGSLWHGDGLVHAYVGDDGVSRWLGPAGWLSSFPAGCLLAVRVARDGAVELTVLAEEPAAAPGLVAAIRAGYDAAVEEPWLPVTSEDLLLAVLAADRTAFTAPAPPISELAAAAGLEQRGESFAHEESVWQQSSRADRAGRVFHRLGPGTAALAALQALALLDDGMPDAAAAHELLDLLHSPDVLEVVADELLGVEDDPEQVAGFTTLAERLAARARQSCEQATVHWLAAVAAERRGAAEEAEAQLRAAVRADPGWEPAEDRLAWYESDHGDAAAAAARWRRLGLTAEESPDLAAVERFETPVEAPKLGRNQPCWCGSGRKYKQCHLGRPAELPPLPDRVSWLRRKMYAYVERRGGSFAATFTDYALALADDEDEDSVHKAMHVPLVSDVVLHEGGWLARFLADRGRLLPDDEAMLAAAWALAERTVIEVLDAVPGQEVTVRDLRTGDRIAVRERTFSTTAEPGQLLCVRIVPDGEGHQFVGSAVRVPPGTETGLLEVLDEHDGHALLTHVAALFHPPTLVTRDGEPLADCRAELAVPDPRAARAALDERYDGDGDGWVSLFAPADDDPDGVERSIRAWLQLDRDTLTVRTMSEPRLDAVLTELAAALPDAQLTSRQCDPVRATDPPPPGDPAALPADVPAEVPAEALQELMDRFERRWCDEQVPALGGLTPRQAAEDPTRRGELARLIASFPEIEPTGGAFGLRPARLRELLGLAAG